MKDIYQLRSTFLTVTVTFTVKHVQPYFCNAYCPLVVTSGYNSLCRAESLVHVLYYTIHTEKSQFSIQYV